jgi:hypothetical protein
MGDRTMMPQSIVANDRRGSCRQDWLQRPRACHFIRCLGRCRTIRVGRDATYGLLRRELFHRFQRAAPSWHTKLVATQEVRYKRFGRPPVRDAPSNQR